LRKFSLLHAHHDLLLRHHAHHDLHHDRELQRYSLSLRQQAQRNPNQLLLKHQILLPLVQNQNYLDIPYLPHVRHGHHLHDHPHHHGAPLLHEELHHLEYHNFQRKSRYMRNIDLNHQGYLQQKSFAHHQN